MGAFQGQPYESVVRLVDSGGLPVTGILFSAVTAKFHKTGTTAFTTKTMSADNWKEISDGFYRLIWANIDMSVLGEFSFMLSGTAFVTYYGMLEVHYPLPPVPPGKCIIGGNVLDIGGDPDQRPLVTFKPTHVPMLRGHSFISSSSLITSPDALGNFSIALVRGAEVLVYLEQGGIRNQITVPDLDTARLEDLLPPIP